MKRFILPLFIFLIIMGALGAAAAVAVYSWASQDLPSYSRVTDYRPLLVTTVYARDGSVMGYFSKERRFLVPLTAMPEHLRLAFLAIEDDKFYQHDGINFLAIARAFVKNLQAGTIKEGASTITQQVVKRLLLDTEKSYERKIKEAILAYRLEKHLSKDEILTIYLNQIFLGAGAYGVEAAARTYFAKHVNELTLAESALLAGLPQAPSKYNPWNYRDAALDRRNVVLYRMHTLGWISKEQYDEARAEEMEFKSMPDPSAAYGAWYLEEVRRRMIEYLSEENMNRLGITMERYGEDALYKSGLHIYTAMEPVHQIAAEKALRDDLEISSKRHGWRGPIEKLDPAEVQAFLDREPLSEAVVSDDAWAKAVVSEVDKDGAKVRVGAYTGYIPVATMSWAREPNVRVSGDNAAKITDARKVLEPNDVVWVSLIPEQEPAIVSAQGIAPGTVIQFALEQYPDVQGAMVSIEAASGDVLALVGGYSFQDSKLNRATQARRQPGSAFKPVVYSAALDNGFTATSMVLDAPIVFVNPYTGKVWRPENFGGKFSGPVMLRTALAKSLNLCTVRIAQQIGIPAVNDRAMALGLEGPFPNELAVSLGAVAVSPLNLTEAYTAFARGGTRVKGRLVTGIKDAWGRDIAVFPPETYQAISPENAYVMQTLLKAVINEGTGGRARVLGRPLAGKTGTSNDEQDAWFMGFTPYMVVGTYVGFDQVAPMGRNETGGRVALPAFVEYMKMVQDSYPPDDFSKPDGITVTQVGNISVPFMPGTGPGTGRGAMDSGDIMDSMAVDPVSPPPVSDDVLKQLF